MAADRDLTGWKASATAPFMTMRRARGTVAMTALEGETFQIDAPGVREIIECYDAAERRADEMARELD
jgi:hypothetical protein